MESEPGILFRSHSLGLFPKFTLALQKKIGKEKRSIQDRTAV